MASANVGAILTNIWIAAWSNESADRQTDPVWRDVLLGLVCFTVVAAVVRALLSFDALVRAAHTLHNCMLRAVVRAPVLFFDSNPIGRILNRFSKDVGAIDDLMPMTFYDFVQCLLMVLSAVLVVCSSVPWIFLAVLPLFLYFVKLRNYYLKTSREVKRLEAISRSPVLSHFTESFDGLVSIRAFGRSAHFMDVCKQRINENTRAYFTFIAGT